MTRFEPKFVFWGEFFRRTSFQGSCAVRRNNQALKQCARAPVCPFDPGSVVMLVMPKGMQHSCRYLFTGAERFFDPTAAKE